MRFFYFSVEFRISKSVLFCTWPDLPLAVRIYWWLGWNPCCDVSTIHVQVFTPQFPGWIITVSKYPPLQADTKSEGPVPFAQGVNSVESIFSDRVSPAAKFVVPENVIVSPNT